MFNVDDVDVMIFLTLHAVQNLKDHYWKKKGKAVAGVLAVWSGLIWSTDQVQSEETMRSIENSSALVFSHRKSGLAWKQFWKRI